MDVRFEHTFSMLIVEASNTGKTTFVRQLLGLGEQMIKGALEVIFYCYGAYQPMFEEMKQELPNIKFIEGFPPDFLDRINPQQRSLLVPDNMTTSLVIDVSMTELFSKTRHLNLSIIFLLHNLFAQGKSIRTVHLNTNYYVIFNSPRDRSQIMTLARQMHPGVGKFMIAAYNDATKRPFGYLLIDVRSNTPEEYRLRANIFPGETQYAYVKREYKKT